TPRPHAAGPVAGPASSGASLPPPRPCMAVSEGVACLPDAATARKRSGRRQKLKDNRPNRVQQNLSFVTTPSRRPITNPGPRRRQPLVLERKAAAEQARARGKQRLAQPERDPFVAPYDALMVKGLAANPPPE